MSSPSNTDLREAIEEVLAPYVTGENAPTILDLLVNAILALFQAHQQQLLTELLGELPESKDTTNPERNQYYEKYENVGFNHAIDQVTEVINRYRQDLANDGGTDGE